jgi:hypothetical protein
VSKGKIDVRLGRLGLLTFPFALSDASFDQGEDLLHLLDLAEELLDGNLDLLFSFSELGGTYSNSRTDSVTALVVSDWLLPLLGE